MDSLERKHIDRSAKRMEQKEGMHGRNVEANFLIFRHGEKASGLVGSDGAVSTSTISPEGLKTSQMLGARLAEFSPPLQSGVKGLHSASVRTYETMKEMEKGYDPQALIGASEFFTREKRELSGVSISSWISRHDEIVSKTMKERGLLPEDYD